ncbi:MAG: hypothetical protein KF816_17045 [Melioribacteraceae bacterium]|nr:hypothetical protein [Melioribacteraceae bacterium]
MKLKIYKVITVVYISGVLLSLLLMLVINNNDPSQEKYNLWYQELSKEKSPFYCSGCKNQLSKNEVMNINVDWLISEKIVNCPYCGIALYNSKDKGSISKLREFQNEEKQLFIGKYGSIQPKWERFAGWLFYSFILFVIIFYIISKVFLFLAWINKKKILNES